MDATLKHTEQFRSLLVAMLGTAVSGFADESTVFMRLAICQQCERFDPMRNRCNICRCKLDDLSASWIRNLRNKLAHRRSRCPLGKWSEVE